MEETHMSKLEMLTPQNSAIALIDYQPAMYQGVQSHDRLVTFNNVQILAKTAKLFGIPTVISTVAKDSFSGPFMPEITQLFPDHPIIDRTSMNSWLDANFRDAVHATRRKKLVVAGLWTEACVLFPTLDLLKEGFEIYVPADALRRRLARGSQSIDGPYDPGRRGSDHVPPVRFRAAAGLGAKRNLRWRDGNPQGPLALWDSGALLQMGAGRARLRSRFVSQGSRLTSTKAAEGHRRIHYERHPYPRPDPA
jgi:nicotinamidase-related amidase